ncbi:MAG TPA: hypothetical protein VFF79_16830 [Conexibacter sp.]|jgi:hypothetical protein|nr:hypothetical protein [Conexibacter sp.]
MSRARRLLTVLACAASACALSAASALAAGHGAAAGQGVVLSSGHHSLRLVDRGHRVADVRVSSTRGLRRGDIVTVRRGRAHVSGHVGRVSFLGRVVHSTGRGAVVRLGDGSTFQLDGAKPHGHRARSAASITINFQGLTPGLTLLVTISTDEQGNVLLTIKVLPRTTDIGANGGELHATGVVTDDQGGGSFGVRADDGSGLRFDDPQRLFEAANAAWCDAVSVSYHQDGRRLIADELRVTGHSTDGGCADNGASDEVDGTVTAIAADASSLTIAPDDGSDARTIPVGDPSLLDGIAVGDDVAVTLDAGGTAVDVTPLVPVDDSGGQ